MPTRRTTDSAITSKAMVGPNGWGAVVRGMQPTANRCRRSRSLSSVESAERREEWDWANARRVHEIPGRATLLQQSERDLGDLVRLGKNGGARLGQHLVPAHDRRFVRNVHVPDAGVCR